MAIRVKYFDRKKMWHYFQPCHSLVDFLLCYVKLSDIQMLNLILGHLFLAIKFEYSEKAAKFCKISTLLLFTVHTDTSKVRWGFCKILWPSQNIWSLVKFFSNECVELGKDNNFFLSRDSTFRQYLDSDTCYQTIH